MQKPKTRSLHHQPNQNNYRGKIMSIPALLVKELREKTGAGFMDCKKALVESNGDITKAVEWLKVKGLSKAAKKSDRVTAEGLTAIDVQDTKAVAIEINSETDFVAKNEQFQQLVDKVCKEAINHSNIDELKKAQTSSGCSIEEDIVASIASIGENLTLRRMQKISINNGVIGSYVHNKTTPSMGKIVVLVGLESDGDKDKLHALAKDIAMHVAAAKPVALNKEDVSPDIIQKEKDIFQQQSRDSGKPENIIEKMVEGRIRKFLEEIVLNEQVHMIEGKTKIADMVQNVAKELGTDVKLSSYVRFEVGDGIEKEQSNFADEVSSVVSNK